MPSISQDSIGHDPEILNTVLFLHVSLTLLCVRALLKGEPSLKKFCAFEYIDNSMNRADIVKIGSSCNILFSIK
jgi:hypothetical protein